MVDFQISVFWPRVNLKHAKKIWGLSGVKWALHDKKNPLFSPKKFEIQNLPLIHLPIYKQIFFSGSSDQKKFFSFLVLHKEKIFYFSRMTPKKKFAYMLVNGLIANFEFQSFWAKKVDFFLSWSAHFTPLILGICIKFFQIYPKA